MLENVEPEYELEMMPTDDASSASRYTTSLPEAISMQLPPDDE